MRAAEAHPNWTPATAVRAWRERAGMTQAQAARWYGTTERTWQRWESGAAKVPAHVLSRLGIGGLD